MKKREEKIPLQALKRFERRVLKGQPGDREFTSVEASIKDLHRLRLRLSPRQLERSRR